MSDQLPLVVICLTVLLPEPVGPMTLEDVDLDISPSKVMARTLSRCPLFPGPLCSPRQQDLLQLLTKVGLSDNYRYPSEVGLSDNNRYPSEVGLPGDDLHPREAAALSRCEAKFGLPDDDLYPSELVSLVWCEVEVGSSDDDLHPREAAAL